MTQYSLFDDNLEERDLTKPAAAVETTLPAAVTPAGAATVEGDEDKATRMARVREPALVCTRCDLSRTRNHVVFGEGNIEYRSSSSGKDRGRTKMPRGVPLSAAPGCCWMRCSKKTA